MPVPICIETSPEISHGITPHVISLEAPVPIAAKLARLARRGATAGGLTPAEQATALQSGWIEISADGAACALTAAGRSVVRCSLSRRQSERAQTDPALTEETRAAAEPSVAGPSTAAPVYNVAESPLTWLRSRRDSEGKPLLGDEQFEAGERLRADLWRAQMTPRVTASWSGIPLSRGERRTAPGAGLDMAESVLAARMRLERAFKAVGKDHFDLLFDVCGHLKGLEQVERDAGLPKRSAKFLLQRALTALARHYGLLPPLDIDAAIRTRLRHWGSHDYRPGVGQWEQG